MELLDGKWLEKFFYLHLAPLWPDGLSAITSSLEDRLNIKPWYRAWECAGRQTGHMAVGNRQLEQALPHPIGQEALPGRGVTGTRADPYLGTGKRIRPTPARWRISRPTR
jgi:hypothetical protein